MTNIDQRYRLLAQATHHRDQLISIAKEFVDLHGEAHGSCEADELMSCILDGEPYEHILERVNRIRAKKQKHRGESSHGEA